MNPPGNHNDALRVATLLFDGATGSCSGSNRRRRARMRPASRPPRHQAASRAASRSAAAPALIGSPWSADASHGCLGLAALVPPGAGLAQTAAETTLDEHGGPVKGVAVSADGSRALTASFDYSVILWDLQAGALLAHLYGHDARGQRIAFLPGEPGDLGERRRHGRDLGPRGRAAARPALRSQRQGRRDRDHARRAARRIRRLGSHGTRLGPRDAARRSRSSRPATTSMRCSFSPDGKTPLAGSSDGSIQIWRATDGSQLTALNGHDFAVTALDLSGGRAARRDSRSIDETVQLWDPEQGERALTLYRPRGAGADRRPVGGPRAGRLWRHRRHGAGLAARRRRSAAGLSSATAAPSGRSRSRPDGRTLLSGGADGLVVSHRLDAKPDAVEPSVARVEEGAPAEDGRGAVLFRKCVACHTVTPDGGHRAGPTLHGLFGRVAGSTARLPLFERPAGERSGLDREDGRSSVRGRAGDLGAGLEDAAAAHAGPRGPRAADRPSETGDQGGRPGLECRRGESHKRWRSRR